MGDDEDKSPPQANAGTHPTVSELRQIAREHRLSAFHEIDRRMEEFLVSNRSLLQQELELEAEANPPHPGQNADSTLNILDLKSDGDSSGSTSDSERHTIRDPKKSKYFRRDASTVSDYSSASIKQKYNEEDSDASWYASVTSSINDPQSQKVSTPTQKQKSGISGNKMLSVAIVLCLISTVGLLYTIMTPSKSAKSLPSAIILTDSRASDEETTPKSLDIVPHHPSDSELENAFVALVGEDIYSSGTSQNLAAWWVLKEDPIRYQASLEQMQQRFLLAYFYFATTNNCKEPWLSCNFEHYLTYPENENRVSTRYAVDEDWSRSCKFMKPLVNEQGHIDGFETVESFRWLSRYSECTWAGIRCKNMETDGDLDVNESSSFNAVVEINLGTCTASFALYFALEVVYAHPC